MSDIVLDLPPPLSVNRTRRVDWRHQAKLREWKSHADLYVMAAKRDPENPLKLEKVRRFEITMVLSEDHCTLDLDNAVKSVVDYLRRIDLILNDAKENMRKLTVEWGYAPSGLRVIVKPMPPTTMADVLQRAEARATQA